MNLAIVGSRNFNDWELCKKTVLDALKEWNIDVNDINNIVSGGARGADTLAERFAEEYGISMIVFKPDWNKHGRAAGILRNSDIIAKSTHVVAFPSKRGRGTQDSIRKAEGSNKKLKIVWID
jgi:hypothetical protein